jgi:hypothetical protein
MKGDRKLRLVPPPAAPAAEGEPPISDAERAAAEALRDALDREPLVADLRAAHAPRPLDGADLDAILARALGDEAAATRAERAAAERLRAELAGEAAIEEAALLRAIKLAAAPTALAPQRNEALIEAALSGRTLRRRLAPVRRIAPVTLATLAGVTALAAGLALFVGQAGRPAPGAATALIRARSTDALFDAATPFPRTGEESARIDRIADARAADLRNNRYARWGVR